jgi:hypothetical protein
MNELQLIFEIETNYQLPSDIKPDGTTYYVNIPRIGKIYNINGLTENYHYSVYPIKPGNKWKHLQEGDLVSFSSSKSDVGQIILINEEMNLILVQLGLDRGRCTRFECNAFAQEHIKVLIKAQGVMHFFNK